MTTSTSTAVALPDTRAQRFAATATSAIDGLDDDLPIKRALRDVARQAVILADAAAASRDLFVETMLTRMSREWSRAAIDAAEAVAEDATPVVVGAGALAPGTRVWHPTNGDSWATLVRVLARDGQVSLHLEDAQGRPVYVNLTLPGSPVVVGR